MWVEQDTSHADTCRTDPSTREPQPVPKIYEFEFDASPDQVFQETLGAVNLLGFSVLESEDASFTFNTGPSIFSNAGQDMTVTAEALGEASSRLVLSGQNAQKGEYGSWGERGRIAKGLAAKVREGLLAH
jgi:hypothetical protein